MDEYVIKCGKLIDGTGAAPAEGAFVLVRRGMIARVERGPASELAHRRDFLDASGKSVLPGLIDAHKHVLNCGGAGLTVGLTATQVLENARQIVRGGVTSVLDLGSGYLIKPLEAILREAPRIYRAITILTCRDGYPGEYMPRSAYKLGAVAECDTAADIKKAVSRMRKLGVAVIKTAVVSRTFDGRPCRCWTDDQLRELTDEAHASGLKVCAHITYSRDYAQAARCGIDSIHHAAFDAPMEERDLADMISKGIVFVPTLSLVDLMVRGMEERWIDNPTYAPPVNRAVKASMRSLTEAYHRCPDTGRVEGLFIKMTKAELRGTPVVQTENVRRYIEMGGKVAMGTDSSLGFSLHTTPVRELELLVAAGMSNLEALRAATSTAASVFGEGDRIGTIEAGKRADILVIDGDPERDISSLKNIDMVIQGGRIVRGKPMDRRQRDED